MRAIALGAIGLCGLAIACGRSDLNDYLEERFFPLDAGEINGSVTDGSGNDGEETGDSTTPPGDSAGGGGPDVRSEATSTSSGSSSGGSSSGGGSGRTPDAEPTCDPSNCTGCCIEQICAQGNQAIACGMGGGACAVCSSFQSCTGGVCQ
jgi:hypothetical protein